MPVTAEAAAKRREVVYKYRFVERTAERTTDESGYGIGRHVDGLAHRRDFGDRDTTAFCI
jgi:hypothetical protein